MGAQNPKTTWAPSGQTWDGGRPLWRGEASPLPWRLGACLPCTLLLLLLVTKPSFVFYVFIFGGGGYWG